MKASIILALLISVAVVSGLVQKTDTLRDGDIIALRNLGSIDNPQHRWLDAYTVDGRVFLSPNTEGVYTGTHWKVHVNTDGSVMLENLGDKKSPDHIWLDGRTVDGTNGLAPHTNAPYTGTHWQVERPSDGSYTFKCLGHIVNNQHIYLDGHTVDGGSGLAPSTNSPYSGTHWAVYTFNTPAPAPTVNTGFLSRAFNDGDIITLKCLGHIINNQHVYLNGNTVDGKVNLVPGIDGDDYSGTHWKVHANTDGTYSFESLGVWLNIQKLFLDGHTVDGTMGLAPHTNAPYTGARWKVEKNLDGSYSFNCQGNIINNQHIYLDGRTIEGSVGLAPNTNAPWTGTHWQAANTYDPCCV